MRLCRRSAALSKRRDGFLGWNPAVGPKFSSFERMEISDKCAKMTAGEFS